MSLPDLNNPWEKNYPAYNGYTAKCRYSVSISYTAHPNYKGFVATEYITIRIQNPDTKYNELLIAEGDSKAPEGLNRDKINEAISKKYQGQPNTYPSEAQDAFNHFINLTFEENPLSNITMEEIEKTEMGWKWSKAPKELAKMQDAEQNAKDKEAPVITDPIKTSSLSPSGKHYSKAGVIYQIKEKRKTFEDAIIYLSTVAPYADSSAGTTQPAKDNDNAITHNNTESSTTVTGDSGLSSNADKTKNAELAKQHPERVVDGVYYEDDAKLKAAKEAKEKRIQEETKQAQEHAQAEAAKLAAAMKNIQQTLYGDNQEVIEQLQGSIGGIELNAVLGDAQSVRQRQRVLDYTKFIGDYKEPSSGKG